MLADLLEHGRMGSFRDQPLPDDWTQGRTTYGGASAAMAWAVGADLAQGLPLKSAQFAFTAPLAGKMDAQTRILKQGRNAIFVGVELTGELGTALIASLLFARARPSNLAYNDMPAPAAMAPQELDSRPRPTGAAAFTAHMDYRSATPQKVKGMPDILRWVRLRDRDGVPGIAELLAVGDALPPAGLALLPEPRPASSCNWTINILDDDPRTTDGWWLLQSAARWIDAGFGSQVMTMWNRNGRAVAQGMQSVAIYG